MSQLPKCLVFLDGNRKAAGSLARLGPDDSFHGQPMCEGDYDDLIVGQLVSIADCLREAGVLHERHDLLHIGNQIEKIDVLCAEVEHASRVFKRFVIIEDKLYANPEGRRDVLGQIVDYSKALSELSFDDFAEEVPQELAAWCEANQIAIRRALAEHRMLLLICSDWVRDSLVEYARYLTDTLPLRQMELALMSLNIYSDGERHLFVPNMAGMMTMPERTLVVKVEVTGAGIRPEDIRSRTEWETPVSGGRTSIDETELLNEIGEPGDPGRTVAEKLLHGASELDAVIEFKAASASVRIYNRWTRKPATLFLVTRRGTFLVRSFSRWLQAADVKPDRSSKYLDELTTIIGESPLMARGDTVGEKAPRLARLVGKEDQVLAVVKPLIAALRDAPAPRSGSD